MQCSGICQMGACALRRNTRPNTATTSPIPGRTVSRRHGQRTKEGGPALRDALVPSQTASASSEKAADLHGDAATPQGPLARRDRRGHRRRRRRLRLIVRSQPRPDPLPRRFKNHRRGRRACAESGGHKMRQLQQTECATSHVAARGAIRRIGARSPSLPETLGGDGGGRGARQACDGGGETENRVAGEQGEVLLAEHSRGGGEVYSCEGAEGVV